MLIAVITILLILILLLLIWMLLICPSDVSSAFYDKFANRAYAHRGLHNSIYPENSIPAFENAVSSGYGIELDIRMTKDGKVIVMHDNNFLRMCGDKRYIAETGYKQIKSLRLSGTDYTVPLLSEALDVIKGQVPVIVEFKDQKNYKALCDAAFKILDNYKGDYCVESFDPRILRYIRRSRPALMRGQLTCSDVAGKPGIGSFILSNLFLNIMSRPHFIAYRYTEIKNINFKLSTGILKGLSAVWTVKTSQDFENICKKDVDFIIFEAFEAPKILYEESR